jgi:hypothetical protein
MPSLAVAGHDVYAEGDAEPVNWKWWHILYFRKDGNPRYPSGAGSLSRQHEKRLMTQPPLCPPEYGYYQPCWRQLPVAPRCLTCETVPANYAVPAYPDWHEAVPPAPTAPAIPPAATPQSLPPTKPGAAPPPSIGVGFSLP